MVEIQKEKRQRLIKCEECMTFNTKKKFLNRVTYEAV